MCVRQGPFAHLHFLKVGEHVVMASLKAVNELVLPILTPANGQVFYMCFSIVGLLVNYLHL